MTTGEACHDPGTTPGDGCDAICELEPSWSCSGSPSVCEALPIPAMSVGELVGLATALLAGGVVCLGRMRRGRVASRSIDWVWPELRPSRKGCALVDLLAQRRGETLTRGWPEVPEWLFCSQRGAADAEHSDSHEASSTRQGP